MYARRAQAGFSLIEVVVFIVVVGIALAGLALLYNQATRSSVDPLIRKQALALASSMLEEIEARAYTFCDPDDPAVYTASGVLNCATQEGLGAEGGETRYNTANHYDNVSDYHGFAMGLGQADPNIRTADNNVIADLASYSVVVTIFDNAGGDLVNASPAIPAAEALRIRVVATHVPTGIGVTLEGYRVRYAPNSP